MRLKQLASIHAGYPFRGKIVEAHASRVVVVQMKDLSLTHGVAHDIDWRNCLPVSPTHLRDRDCLTPGDILVAARGSHHYAVAIPPSLRSSGFQAVASPHFFVVRLRDWVAVPERLPEVLPEYVAWFLNQRPVQRHFEQQAEGSVAKSIRRSVLEEAPMVIPPLEKQRALVALATTMLEQQQILERLVRSNARILQALANDLVRTDALNREAS